MQAYYSGCKRLQSVFLLLFIISPENKLFHLKKKKLGLLSFCSVNILICRPGQFLWYSHSDPFDNPPGLHQNLFPIFFFLLSHPPLLPRQEVKRHHASHHHEAEGQNHKPQSQQVRRPPFKMAQLVPQSHSNAAEADESPPKPKGQHAGSTGLLGAPRHHGDARHRDDPLG